MTATTLASHRCGLIYHRRRFTLALILAAVSFLSCYLYAADGAQWRGETSSSPQSRSRHRSPRHPLHRGPQQQARPHFHEERYATLWHHEARAELGLDLQAPFDRQPEAAGKVSAFLDEAIAAGMDVVFSSYPWALAQPMPPGNEGADEPPRGRFGFVDSMNGLICSRGLRVVWLWDGHTAPPWLWEELKLARAENALGDKMPSFSLFHADARRLNMAALGRFAEHLTFSVPGGCLHSVSASYNNEFETKFTQTRDLFQDYSPFAKHGYRQFLRHVNGDLQFWVDRYAQSHSTSTTWGPYTSPRRWQEVSPPILSQRFGNAGFDASAQYFDFMRFRGSALAELYEESCWTVRAAGCRCSLHFGEFLTMDDAIYQDVFANLAPSPWLDVLIIDSNFWKPAGVLSHEESVLVASMLASVTASYGKDAYFEAAAERVADTLKEQPSYFHRILNAAMAYGMTGTSVTNTNNRVSLQDAFPPRTTGARSNEVAGLVILTPFYDFYARRGVKAAHRDPDIHQRSMLKIFKKMQRDPAAMRGGEPALHTYVDIPLFSAKLLGGSLRPALKKVVFVEPYVITSGDAALVERIERFCAKDGIEFQRVKHSIPEFPEVGTTVLDDLHYSFRHHRGFGMF